MPDRVYQRLTETIPGGAIRALRFPRKRVIYVLNDEFGAWRR